MPIESIFSLSQNENRNDKSACRVLDKNGIHTINDLKQFISENQNWADLLERFKGMGPIKLEVIKAMINRLKD